MRVILSRKGFDSKYGCVPSPILPDGRMLPMPIPVANDADQYEALYPDCSKLKAIVKERSQKAGIRDCHVDPDLLWSTKRHDDSWRAAFGQSGAAASHLDNKEVNIGDLFMFFGWYEHLNEENRHNKGFHAIWGYLQVGAIRRKKEECGRCLHDHPHAKYFDNGNVRNNRIYTAKDKCTWNADLPAYGVFKYHDGLRLTRKGFSKSRWDCDKLWGRYTVPTYHKETSWSNGIFQSASIGQEFVFPDHPMVVKWAQDIITKTPRWV